MTMLCDRCGPTIGEHLPDPGDVCGLCGDVYGPVSVGDDVFYNWLRPTALEAMKEALDDLQPLL